MQAIEVDEEVYVAIQQRAVPFVDKAPNDVLRRVFGLDKSRSADDQPDLDTLVARLLAESAERRKSRPKRRPRANLSELIRAGIIKDGEPLKLVDSSGAPVSGVEVQVAGSEIRYNGRIYSMSNLATQLLKKHCGYRSSVSRGPMFWVTSEGTSIKDLWDEYLHQRVDGQEK